MNSNVWEMGSVPADSFEECEWIFFGSLCIEAGTTVSVYCNFLREGTKRLGITDILGRNIGTITARGGPRDGRSVTPETGVPGAADGIITVPPDMPSGLFLVDGKYAFIISRPFELKNITIALPTTTMWIFNDFGGYSLYQTEKRRHHLFSTRRPMPRHAAEERLGGFLAWAAKRFTNHVNYIGDEDLREYLLRNTDLLIVPGRSEYWTRESRSALDSYIENGGPVLFLSSETMFLEVDRFDNGATIGYYRYGSAFNVDSPRSGEWAEPLRNYPLLPSIGPNPLDGGFLPSGDINDQGYGVYTICASSPLLEGTDLEPGDRLRLPSVAYDGLPLLGYNGETPIIDQSKIPFARSELIAWNFGRNSPKGNIGAFFAFQKEASAGVCVHTGSFSWGLDKGLGGYGEDSAKAIRIVENAITLLVSRKPIFSHSAP